MSKYMVFLGNCPSMDKSNIDKVFYFSSIECVFSMIRVLRAYNAVVFKEEKGLFEYYCDACHFDLRGDNELE
ncbi:hypothetical protein [Sigmofec virus UA08Rod_6997]|uniref:Uncharacterized protein n=1 Tax=Sigmofec virus UA08Rod_6997 TaxID=2929243 RepID=A0A976N119_9VIRU|nr:hypothetical protein [Sigmofec virus UA08Rod_6997]